jgi:tetratricopeptide (TPR) repeat protein
VFISHTVELRNFPQAKSYIAEVERAISAAGHVIVDMADFPAANQPPARLCAERVRSCEVYLGILGTRYGSPVRDKQEVSYTELEFDTATEAGLDRLVFLLDIDAEEVGIPPSSLIDREFGARQDDFRRRVQDSGLTTRSFADPATLGKLVERSLRELAETRQRIDSGIQREQIPAEPQPVRSSKFVNPPPAIAPTWFRGRQVETGLLGRHVTDPGIRLVTVAGRAGIGKTALVCRLLKGLEAGRIPGADVDGGAVTVGGIVYLSSNGAHQVTYPTLVADLLRLLPSDEARRLGRFYESPHKPADMMLALLEAFPAGEPVVVLLDNLESVMDTEHETLTEQALHEALSAVLTAPAHAVTVIATTRVLPTAFLQVEPAKQRQLRLEEGLGSPDAENVLRELDEDGRLGLRDASDDLLDGLRRLTLGVPRALEAVKAILEGDGILTPRDLLDRTGRLPEDRVTHVLVGEAYDLLDVPAQQVMQALSVCPAPVSEVGVDFLLRPVNPTTDAAPILARLVRRQMVRFADRHYDLHPLDREYARGKLPLDSPRDATNTFTITGLQTRAADYYGLIRTPRTSWRTLEDLQPQLAEFELRCDTGDYESAAIVLGDIDFNYLRLWGHTKKLIDLRGRIHGKISDPALNREHLSSLGRSHSSLGDYRQAIDLYSQALAISREIGDREGEGIDLGDLGSCWFDLGDYQQAIDLHTQALAISREIGDRLGEGIDLGNLGSCWSDLGDYQQAMDLHSQALAISREIGDRETESTGLGDLGNCYERLGDYQQAIDLHTQALAISQETGDREAESSDLGNLGLCWFDLGDYQQAMDLYTQALAISREIGDRLGESVDLGNLGSCWSDLGDYQRAIDLHTQALAISQAIDNPRGESADLNNLALCHYSLGDYQQAIELHAQALATAREIGYRYEEANALGYLGRAWLASGDRYQAMTLFEETVGITDMTGDVEPRVTARSWLAQARLQVGDSRAALAAATETRELPYPREEPTMRLLEGMALLGLRRAGDSAAAFDEALGSCNALLALAGRNVAALQVRALALSGLCVATSTPGRAGDAVEAFARARAVTDAAGVVADTRRLFTLIAAHDSSGTLAEVEPG